MSRAQVFLCDPEGEQRHDLGRFNRNKEGQPVDDFVIAKRAYRRHKRWLNSLETEWFIDVEQDDWDALYTLGYVRGMS